MNRLLRCCFFILAVTSALNARAQQFRVDTLARAPQIQLPSAIAFLPASDNKFFLAERNTGRVRLFDGMLRPSPFVTLHVEDDDEQGLLGLAVDPHYPDSPYIYVYYVRALDRAGILERYRDLNGEGVSPQLLLFIARRDEATGNNGGSLRFGPDGKLYVAVGDHLARPSNAQDTLGGRNLRGKILRLNPDGTIPDDNPFSRRYYWSLGHRDPGGMGFDPATGSLYVTESGASNPNAIITVPRKSNLGWPGRTFSGPDPDRQPKMLYHTGRGEQPVLTGVCVYRGDAFPRLKGKILFTGNADPSLWVGTLNGAGDSLTADPMFRSNTGFADVQVGPDGCIYLVNGPYLASRILRLFPLPPRFTSEPPTSGSWGVEYHYTPVFRGTPPALAIMAGPEGMTIDSVTCTVRWNPTKAQALRRTHAVLLRAQNGAGWADQRFEVTVENVNEPPLPFALVSPPDGTEERFLGEEPFVTFSWQHSYDPDLDSVHYKVQIDTVNSFDSPFRIDVQAGTIDSVRAQLPSVSHQYFWRVVASDGLLNTVSFPSASHLEVIVSKFLGREKVRHVERTIEQLPPNSINPPLGVKYTLLRPGFVRLTVYNLLGQEVARLIDGIQQEGTYEVNFAEARLPSGLYFYRLIAPGLVETRKVVVMR